MPSNLERQGEDCGKERREMGRRREREKWRRREGMRMETRVGVRRGQRRRERVRVRKQQRVRKDERVKSEGLSFIRLVSLSVIAQELTVGRHLMHI